MHLPFHENIHLLLFARVLMFFQVGVCHISLNNRRSDINDNYDKRTSLVCAVRLADTLCPPKAPIGRLGTR